MKVYRDIREFNSAHRPIITIGTFDGVHLGHRKIINRIQEIKAAGGGETFVFTFDPHPRKVLFPGQRDLKLLSTTAEKISLLEKSGVDHVLLFPFSRKFAELSADAYVRTILVEQLRAGTLVIGYDHRFGNNREGDIHLLRQYGKQLDFSIEEIPAQDIDNINISSTRIRKALEEGEVKTAAVLLGYTWFMEGLVVKGKQLGRKIGYPTANMQISDPDKLIPRTGVYVVEVELEGNNYRGMMSIGVNPTTDKDEQVKLEVNIFDFEQEIYGRNIKVSLKERLRDEEKFDNLEELIKQLHKDKERSLQVFLSQ